MTSTYICSQLIQALEQAQFAKHRALISTDFELFEIGQALHQLCQIDKFSHLKLAYFYDLSSLNENEQRERINLKPSYKPKEGQKLLGQDYDLIIFEYTTSFSPNSFNAVCGAIKTSGLILFIKRESISSYADLWLTQHLQKWPFLTAKNLTKSNLNKPILNQLTPPLAEFENIYAKMSDRPISYTQTDADIWVCDDLNLPAHTKDQAQAILAIEHVLKGHRNCPLILHAGRGRGKSASLGLAAGKILAQTKKKILITAPSFSAIQSVFEFIQKFATHNQIKFTYDAHQIIFESGSLIEFLAPDFIVKEKPIYDLLLIDEAAALPLPMLEVFAQHYSRLVYSSTLYGYEGSGKGFVLKFIPWLKTLRSGMKIKALCQPIRFIENDLLEQWLFQTFLFDVEVKPIESWKLGIDFASAKAVCESKFFKQVFAAQLFHHPDLLQQIFALLISAHYQTTPNDLWLLLSDPSLRIFYLQNEAAQVMAALVTVEEGGLNYELSQEIMYGKRRPKGQLAASYLTNQFAQPLFSQLESLRVMRIAVHPQLQGQGLGQLTLKCLTHTCCDVDFISTSFGSTASLISFWRKNYQLIHLGTKKDKASGNYSALMLLPISNRAKKVSQQAQISFNHQFLSLIKPIYEALSEETLFTILQSLPYLESRAVNRVRLQNYVDGGNAYETCYADILFFLTAQISSSQIPLSTGLKICLAKVYLQKSWQDVASQFLLSGRKQVETSIKAYLAFLLNEAEFTL